MNSPYRVALIGAGGIGALRAKAVSAAPDFNLAVICDVLEDRAKALAERHAAEAATDAEQVIARSDIDMVIVSTPPNFHASVAIPALQSGKHVLCEKPLAHTLEDAEAMCAAARQSGTLLKTGFNHRYFPAMAFARHLIDSGKIGQVMHVKSYAGHPGGKEFGHDWIHDGRVTGGGSLVDNGIHILDLTRYFLGEEVTSAVGYSTNLIWPFKDAEDNGFALFRTPGGRIAQVHASWTHWRGYLFWVEIFGTRGYVKASYPPMLAEWGQTPEPGIRSKRHFEIFPAFQVQERLKGWEWTIIESFLQELSDFAAGIRLGKDVPATGVDGLRAMQLAHAVYCSSQEGVEVKL